MNDMAKKGDCNVETYDYRSDFKLLTRKEKCGVLKNAKHLLKLQRENNAIFVNSCSCKKVDEKYGYKAVK